MITPVQQNSHEFCYPNEPAGRSTSPMSHNETLRWNSQDGGQLELIDQTLLPDELSYLTCRDVETVWQAIKRLQVRGAPAIGVSAS